MFAQTIQWNDASIFQLIGSIFFIWRSNFSDFYLPLETRSLSKKFWNDFKYFVSPKCCFKLAYFITLISQKSLKLHNQKCNIEGLCADWFCSFKLRNKKITSHERQSQTCSFLWQLKFNQLMSNRGVFFYRFYLIS